MHVAVPSHHDDDHGGIAGWAATGSGDRNRIGTAAAVGYYNLRRAHSEPGTDLVHYASGLSLYGPVAMAIPRAQSGWWASFACWQPCRLKHSILPGHSHSRKR